MNVECWKNGMAAEIDDVTGEILMYGYDLLMEELCNLFNAGVVHAW